MNTLTGDPNAVNSLYLNNLKDRTRKNIFFQMVKQNTVYALYPVGIKVFSRPNEQITIKFSMLFMTMPFLDYFLSISSFIFSMALIASIIGSGSPRSRAISRASPKYLSN